MQVDQLQEALSSTHMYCVELLNVFTAKLQEGTNPSPVAAADYRNLVNDKDANVKAFFYFTFGLFVLNWAVRKLIAEPSIHVILNLTLGNVTPANNSDRAMKRAMAKRAATKEKFAQSFMEMLFYSIFSVFGLLLIPGQEWFWPAENWFKDRTMAADNAHAIIQPAVLCYYLLYGGRYLQGLVSVFLEHQRKDFWEMVAHHTFTVILVFGSLVTNYTRVGVVIMVLLDIADVPLHTAKQFKYMGMQLLADLWFVVFVIVFSITRCAMFPYVIFCAHSLGPVLTVFTTVTWVILAFCYLLGALQFVWMYLIVVAVVKMIRTGGVEDVRSDIDTDDDKTD